MAHTRHLGVLVAVVACATVAGCGGSSGKTAASSSTLTSSTSVAPTTPASTSTSAPASTTAAAVPVGQTMKGDGFTVVVGKATDITHSLPSDAGVPNGNPLLAVGGGVSVLKIPITVVNTGSSTVDYLSFKVDGTTNFGGSVVEDEGFGWGSEFGHLGGMPYPVAPGEKVTQDYAYSVETGQSLKLQITPPTGAPASFIVSLGGNGSTPSPTGPVTAHFGVPVVAGDGLKFIVEKPVRDSTKDEQLSIGTAPAYRVSFTLTNDSKKTVDPQTLADLVSLTSPSELSLQTVQDLQYVPKRYYSAAFLQPGETIEGSLWARPPSGQLIIQFGSVDPTFGDQSGAPTKYPKSYTITATIG